jgi:hypothetical protein
MTQATAAIGKIPTVSLQLVPDRTAKSPVAGFSARAKKASGTRRSPVFASGSGRAATRGSGEVIELECGVTVYPARSAGGRWRAVWHEDGQRRQCEAPTEVKLAAKLEKEPQAPQDGLPAAHSGRYPLAERLAARTEQARAEQEAGTNPLGLLFPAPRGGYWRSSNFSRRVLARAYRAAGWRGAGGDGGWLDRARAATE